MKRKWFILGILLLTVLLSGCTPKQETAAQTTEPPSILGTITQQPAMQLPSVEPLPEGIDPSAEEDRDAEPVVGFSPLPAAVATEVPSAQFAGATPIPLNPIDVTNPPKEELTFTYTTYEATKLGISFEAPTGYIVDDTGSDTYVLRQPDGQILDDYRVEITFSIRPVANTYVKNDIRADLRSYLDELGRVNNQRWEPSTVTERSLLNAGGYYANYRGVLTSGVIYRGRVHMSLLPNNRVLTVHITCPAEYNSDFTGVFTHIRNTLKTL